MNTTAIQEFEHHAARAFFACAWADACEEAGEASILSGNEILDIMPTEVDPAADHAARTLRLDFERLNGCTIADALVRIEAEADGDREPTVEMFGHYCAMQAMGHGVGLYDAFGSVSSEFTVPYVEFGSHSLALDYFTYATED